MANREDPPATLAELLRRRAMPERSQSPSSSTDKLFRSTATNRPAKKSPIVDRLGQFGLLFSEDSNDTDTQDTGTAEARTKAETENSKTGTPAFEEETAAEPIANKHQERKPWGVAELVSALRHRVEREYADVWVEGEISNCRPAPSGHLYFTIKDGDAQLLVVVFRREASLLKFKPADGLSILARGRVSVYEGRGQLQLIANSLEPRGTGALQLAFEQLKARLRAEGLFNPDRKRVLPPFPRTVGVITSTKGAVLRDIHSVVRRRHSGLNLLVYPATMQGSNSSADVIEALHYFNSAEGTHRPDLIVIARGGGSFEDLNSFNDEALARTIASSDLPVVSAIGHETDFTIVDFVADLRAPTPSAAAEIMTASQHRVEEHIYTLAERLSRVVRYQGMQARQRLFHIGADGVFARMRDSINRRHQRVDAARFRLDSLSQSMLAQRASRLRKLVERLERQNIHRRMVQAVSQQRSLAQRLSQAGSTLLTPPQQRLLRTSSRLYANADFAASRTQRWARADARLHALSPTAILQRGYTLLYREDGTLLRNANDVEKGSSITAQLAHGSLRVTVIETQPTETKRRA